MYKVNPAGRYRLTLYLALANIANLLKWGAYSELCLLLIRRYQQAGQVPEDALRKPLFGQFPYKQKPKKLF